MNDALHIVSYVPEPGTAVSNIKNPLIYGFSEQIASDPI